MIGNYTAEMDRYRERSGIEKTGTESFYCIEAFSKVRVSHGSPEGQIIVQRIVVAPASLTTTLQPCPRAMYQQCVGLVMVGWSRWITSFGMVCRLVCPKYNPARTFTHEGTVGLGGAYMCIYPMNSPGTSSPSYPRQAVPVLFSLLWTP